MDFIDPESIKIALRVRINSMTLGLNPGTQEPSCFIKRVQLSNGQCCDISECGRRCSWTHLGITGFWELAEGTPASVPAESFQGRPNGAHAHLSLRPRWAGHDFLCSNRR